MEYEEIMQNYPAIVLVNPMVSVFVIGFLIGFLTFILIFWLQNLKGDFYGYNKKKR
jgi:hypothetical protein